MKHQMIVVPVGEVLSTWMAAIERGEYKLDSSQPMYNKLVGYHRNPTHSEGFEGQPPTTTCQQIREGLHSPIFSHSAEHAVLSDRMAFCYSDEGDELDVDRVMGGYDDYFLDRQPREAKPGLRLQFEFAFAWTTAASVIEEYGAWCASLITSLETSGYDLVVDIWIHLDDLFIGQRNTRTSVLVRVKEENELSSFTDWSAMFGKGGYRHLGFLAKCLAGDQIGKRVTGSFGHTIGSQDWSVKYDKENQQVSVGVNQRAGARYFPVEKLNKDAMECGLIPFPISVNGKQ